MSLVTVDRQTPSLGDADVIGMDLMREFTLWNVYRRAGEILGAVEQGEVIILRYWERRVALLCPYPRGYYMNAERFRTVLKRAADEIADSADDLPRPVGPRIACHVCGRSGPSTHEDRVPDGSDQSAAPLSGSEETR